MTDSSERNSRGLSGWWVIAAWVVTIFLVWLRYGAWLGIRVEGNDPTLIPTGPLILPTLVLIVALVLPGCDAGTGSAPDRVAGVPTSIDLSARPEDHPLDQTDQASAPAFLDDLRIE